MPADLRGAIADADVWRLGAVCRLSLAGVAAAWIECGLLRRAVGRRIAATGLGRGTLGRTLSAAVVAAAVAGSLRPLLCGPAWLEGGLAVLTIAAVYAPLAGAL